MCYMGPSLSSHRKGPEGTTGGPQAIGVLTWSRRGRRVPGRPPPLGHGSDWRRQKEGGTSGTGPRGGPRARSGSQKDGQGGREGLSTGGTKTRLVRGPGGLAGRPGPSPCRPWPASGGGSRRAVTCAEQLKRRGPPRKGPPAPSSLRRRYVKYTSDDRGGHRSTRRPAGRGRPPGRRLVDRPHLWSEDWGGTYVAVDLRRAGETKKQTNQGKRKKEKKKFFFIFHLNSTPTLPTNPRRPTVPPTPQPECSAGGNARAQWDETAGPASRPGSGEGVPVTREPWGLFWASFVLTRQL